MRFIHFLFVYYTLLHQHLEVHIDLLAIGYSWRDTSFILRSTHITVIVAYCTYFHCLKIESFLWFLLNRSDRRLLIYITLHTILFILPSSLHRRLQ